MRTVWREERSGAYYDLRWDNLRPHPAQGLLGMNCALVPLDSNVSLSLYLVNQAAIGPILAGFGHHENCTKVDGTEVGNESDWTALIRAPQARRCPAFACSCNLLGDALPVRFFAPAALLAALILWAAGPASAQSSSSQPGQTVQQGPVHNNSYGNGTYVAVNPLAGVRYDNRYDFPWAWPTTT